MGLRFRKSVKIAPGVKLNLGKKSAGISIGGKFGGVSMNSKTGTTVRATAPGTGLSYRKKVGGSTAGTSAPMGEAGDPKPPRKKNRLLPVLAAVMLLLGLISCVAGGSNSESDPAPSHVAASVGDLPQAETPVMSDAEPVEKIPETSETAPDPAETAPEMTEITPEPAEDGSESPRENPPVPSVSAPVSVPEKPEPVVSEAVEIPVIGNRNSKKYHETWCASVSKMKDSNKVSFPSAEDARANGYEPCKNCH